MKYVLSLIAGMCAGVALFLLTLWYNPFYDSPKVSPLAVADYPLMDLGYSAAPSDAIAYTDDGSSHARPAPEDILELWEPAIRKTRILVTAVERQDGEAGLGIKFSSDSESTRLLRGEALTDTAWHIWLPGSGTFFVGQRENLWSYLRNIVLPVRLGSGDSWRGSWHGIVTSGPRALGTADAWGGSGRYAELDSEALESWTARAWSEAAGPVAMTGTLTIAVPEQARD